nr:5-aminoimidazole ribonucleotide carboxylase/ 4-N-succinylamino carbonyl-5-aminoimidazole ribonucleotide synthase - chicken (fragments) [Gallus gallus]
PAASELALQMVK